MIANRLPRDVVEEMSREAYRKQYPEGQSRVEPANVRPALQLLGADRIQIPYRGHLYELGHVSFEDGLRLVDAREAVAALTNEDATPENKAAYLRGMRLVVSMAPRYLLPMGRVRRVLWRLRIRRNPFRTATDQEVGQLLGFFLASRMRSRVQFRGPAAEPANRPTS